MGSLMGLLVFLMYCILLSKEYLVGFSVFMTFLKWGSRGRSVALYAMSALEILFYGELDGIVAILDTPEMSLYGVRVTLRDISVVL